MPALGTFRNLPLRGGLILREIVFAADPFTDAIGRPALARALITGTDVQIQLAPESDEASLSISIYHEVLEAVAISVISPPAAVAAMNEGAFEAAAISAYETFGPAAPDTVNRMLEMHGFVH
jgi:hypothetical protein